MTPLFAHGETMVWLTGGAFALCVLMIVGLVILVVRFGAGTFWPGPVVRIETLDGKVCMGELTREETYHPEQSLLEGVAQEDKAAVWKRIQERGGRDARHLFRTGNFDLEGTHFQWVADYAVKSESRPDWAMVIERLAWGRFYGIPKAFLVDKKPVAETPAEVWAEYERRHGEARDRYEERRRLEKDEIGDISRRQEEGRLELKRVEMESGKDSPEWRRRKEEFDALSASLGEESKEVRRSINELNRENARYGVVLTTAKGVEKTIPLADIVRAYPANRLGFGEKLGVYFSRWGEYLWDEPREANSEGGVFPAIFGTVAMTLIMAILVVPFGVLAALYLREYAKAGTIVSIVRIAINNLAGVPSIVFGVFGLGFFCYAIGGGIDGLFYKERLPNPTFGTGGLLWASFTLALLTLPVVIVATEEALAAVPRSMREGSFACGASQWQTIRRIVLPRAMPGIMTGTILAIARGAGEVAPLMLVGAVKLAPELPIDGVFPYVHAQRSFMHLGFHIYDLAFQSQNSEAAKPMVFTTTLLLIGIILTLNVVAVMVRTRLRRRFLVSQM
ncbi:MAG TPA: phosphate ABC transporter permease PstA [Planctomycetota bacterium]|nr:phosphate ABC transporter permease PstA [Planctomycetota bacterium]